MNTRNQAMTCFTDTTYPSSTRKFCSSHGAKRFTQFVYCTGYSASKAHQILPSFPRFSGSLSICLGFRGTRGPRCPGEPGLAGCAGLSGRACGPRGADGTGRPGGAHRLQGGQQGKVCRLPRNPGGVVDVCHIEVAVVGHQLPGLVAPAQHPGRGYAPRHAGVLRGAGLGRAGLRHNRRTRRLTGRWAGRRAAAGRAPGPAAGHAKVTALVSLHSASFLRQDGGTI